MAYIYIYMYIYICVHICNYIYIHTHTHEYKGNAVRQTYAKLLGLPLDVPAACSDWSSVKNKPGYRVEG